MASDASIDITGDHCPMTFVRVKLKLETMESGEILSVRLNGGEPLLNVPRSLKDENHTVSEPRPVGECYTIMVKKC